MLPAVRHRKTMDDALDIPLLISDFPSPSAMIDEGQFEQQQ
jgi:hypothetical protein